MSDIAQQSTDGAVSIAANLGLECFFPTDRELFLDLDWGRPLNGHVLAAMDTDEKGLLTLDPSDRLQTTSKSGNRHVYIRLKDKMSRVRRIALQAALGSDPVKEMLSIRRLVAGSDPGCVIALFETPAEAERVRAWRNRTV